MMTCYNCGGTTDDHDPACPAVKNRTPPAMNTASPTDSDADGHDRPLPCPNCQRPDYSCRCAAPVGQGSANQCGTCDGNGIVGSPPDQYFDCPECAAMRDCPDCEGSGRISPSELCKRCNESGILPDQGSATSGEAAFEQALDAEYPIPDSPHASVLQHAAHNRIAFGRGYRAALAASAEQSNRGIDLHCVIQWLEGGRDPKLAAQELRLVQAKIEASCAEQSNSAGSARQGGITKQLLEKFEELAAPVAERAAAPASVPEDRDTAAYQIVNWLRRQANGEKDPAKRAAFIEAHNNALAIKQAAPEVALPAAPSDNSLVGAKEKE